MCSVEGDIEDLSDCSVKQINTLSRKFISKCKKCDEKSTILSQKKDPFCKSCFLDYCNHKFRSTIGKSKLIKHGDKVLIACSGGRKSSALLHMVMKTLEFASLRQISFEPGILFINDSVVIPLLNDDLKSNVLHELKATGIPVLCSSLEMVYQINTSEELYWDADSFLAGSFSSVSHLQNYLKECIVDMNLSAKADLVKHLRILLMTEIANLAGYKYLFVGDTATSLAIELLSDIALGRGSQISSDTSFYDSRYKVPVCRPLRECLGKEVALYSHFHNITYNVLPNFLTKTAFNSCIQRLSESFICNLQETFPATIFTVFRTGGKLFKNTDVIDKENCFLCKSKLDNMDPESCSALEALKVSEKLSAGSPNESPSNWYISSKNTIVDETTSSMQIAADFEKINILQYMCHGCSVTFRNVNKSSFHHLLPASHTKMDRHQMRKEIQEFLFDES